MHYLGILIGVICFLVIGLFHPIVIKTEYYFGKKTWPIFLVAGLLFLAASMWVESPLPASVLGVVGCSCLWSIQELFEQEKRVAKGWFPKREVPVSKKTEDQQH